MVRRLLAARQRAAARSVPAPAAAAPQRPVPPPRQRRPSEMVSLIARQKFVPPPAPRPLLPQIERILSRRRPLLLPPSPAIHQAWEEWASRIRPQPAPPPRPPRVLPPDAPERRWLEVGWLVWQMSGEVRELARWCLLQAVEDRQARGCPPLKAPKQQQTLFAPLRFGQRGERLRPQGVLTLCRKLKMETREGVRLLEASQGSHLERNHLLAMRGARLGQLCAELEARGLDAFEVLRWELAALSPRSAGKAPRSPDSCCR